MTNYPTLALLVFLSFTLSFDLSTLEYQDQCIGVVANSFEDESSFIRELTNTFSNSQEVFINDKESWEHLVVGMVVKG